MASLEEITRHDRTWLIVRIVLSVVFTIALVAWIVAMWRENMARRSA